MLDFELLKAQISNKRLKIQNLVDLRDGARTTDPFGCSHVFVQEYINQVWEGIAPLKNKLWDAWLESPDGKKFRESCLRPILGKLQEPSYMRQLFTIEAI